MTWRALVTGTSSGLGEQFSHLFAADGIDLAITSSPRSAVRIEEAMPPLNKEATGTSASRCARMFTWPPDATMVFILETLPNRSAISASR